VPTAEEEAALLGRVRGGADEVDRRSARDELVERNIRLVLAVAMEFRRVPVPIEDIIQEGFIGLIRAIDNFDPSRDRRLIAYAGPLIRYAVMDMLKVALRIVKPAKTSWDIRVKVTCLRRRLGLWGESFESIAVNRLGATPKAAKRAYRCARPEIQMSAMVDDEDERTLTMEDDPSPEIDAEVEREMKKTLAALPTRQRDAVEQRFGLNGKSPMNYTEAGRRRGVTSECVRKRTEAGLEMLRRAMS
jgi:RNA polymerase primary sigma factor